MKTYLCPSCNEMTHLEFSEKLYHMRFECPECRMTMYPIDDDIAPIVKALNDKGYPVMSACSGHIGFGNPFEHYENGEPVITPVFENTAHITFLPAKENYYFIVDYLKTTLQGELLPAVEQVLCAIFDGINSEQKTFIKFLDPSKKIFITISNHIEIARYYQNASDEAICARIDIKVENVNPTELENPYQMKIAMDYALSILYDYVNDHVQNSRRKTEYVKWAKHDTLCSKEEHPNFTSTSHEHGYIIQ